MSIKIELEIKFRALFITFGTTRWNLSIPVVGLINGLADGVTSSELGHYNNHGVKLTVTAIV